MNRQHTVTKSLLKAFSDTTGNVAVYNAERHLRQLKPPGAGIFTTKFDSYDSRGSEDFWNSFETNFPRAMQKIRQRSALDDPDAVGILKDLMAVHWARSPAIMVARDLAVDAMVEGSKRKMLDEHPGMVSRALRERTGLVVAPRSAMQWIVDTTHERVVDANQAMWHSQRNPVNFKAARDYFETLELQVAYVQSGDLVISDCPVITARNDRPGTGPHQGVALMDADHLVMPLAPDVLLGLGQASAVMNLMDEGVNFYNSLQWPHTSTGSLQSLVVEETCRSNLKSRVWLSGEVDDGDLPRRS